MEEVTHPGATSRQHWSSARLPERSKRLLSAIHALTSKWLQDPLRHALDGFSQQLFQRADLAHNPTEQRSRLNSHTRVRKHRKQLEAGFVQALNHSLMQMGDQAPTDTPDAPAALSLVDMDQHDLASEIDSIVARAGARNRSVLFELGYRMAVLVGAPPLEGAGLPLSPRALTTLFCDASAILDLEHADQIRLLEHFEAHLLQSATSLYVAVNQLLAHDGILPHLHAYRIPQQPRHPAMQGADAAVGGNGSAASAPSSAEPAPAADNPDPISVLDSLRETLIRRRTSGGAANTSAASPKQLQAALSALQQHLGQLSQRTSRELRSAQRLRDELQTQLNAGRPAGSPPVRLNDEQDSMLELVSSLFDQMAGQVQRQGAAHAALGGLQLPILRAALTDPNVLTQPRHPARRLLSTVTRVANDWLDEFRGEPDQGLVSELEDLIERANHEPPSSELFASLLARIERHLAELTLRARVAERRNVQAMEGQDNLHRARQRAQVIVSERIARAQPHGLLRTLMDKAWTDVLTLDLLRHGENGAEVQHTVAMTDQLLGLVPVANTEQLKQGVLARLAQVGVPAEDADRIVERVIGGPAAAQPGRSATSLTEIAIQLKQRPPLGIDATAAAPPAQVRGKTAGTPPHPEPAKQPVAPTVASVIAKLTTHHRPPAGANPVIEPPVRKTAATQTTAPPANTPPDKRVLAELERLRKLPFGTWFEITDRKTGRLAQCKLAWYSTMSGQALLVNRRGQRIEEIGLEQLAQRIVDGAVRNIPPRQETLFDHAWRNLVQVIRGNQANTDNARRRVET